MSKSRNPRGTRGRDKNRAPSKPLPEELLTLEAGRPAHGGAVIAKADDGRTVFLRGAIEGETVKAKVSAEHKTFLWADTVEVLVPSPHRVGHVWEDPADVGAANADLGHVDPAHQLQWKADVLKDQLRRIGGPELAARALELYPDGIAVNALTDPEGARVRTRVQLGVGPDLRLGMRPYRSSGVVPVGDVPVAVEAIADIAALRPVDGGPWADKWKPGDRVSVVAPNGSSALVVTPSGAYDVASGERYVGKAEWKVDAAGASHTFRVSPGGFWQTHVEGPAALVEAVLRAAKIEAGQTVVELYSGAGLLSRFIADEVGPSGLLLTLEGDEDAVEDAGENLLDAIEDDFVEVFQGSVDATSIGELSEQAKRGVDTVVLDPPRKGAGLSVVSAIADTGAARVVLVSCDAAAAARDIRDFRTFGFELIELEAWDLFPNTHHFECVAELVRSPGL